MPFKRLGPAPAYSCPRANLRPAFHSGRNQKIMASAAQTLANQNNSQLSTGPRTGQGKQISSQNATRHGMCSREFVILEGEQDDFDQIMAELKADFQPLTAYELELFRQIAHACWTLRRCRLAEAALSRNSGRDPLLDEACDSHLKRIDTYSRRAERSFHHTVKALREVQTERRFRREACPYPAKQEEASVHDDAVLISYQKVLPAVHHEVAFSRRAQELESNLAIQAFITPGVNPAALRATPTPQPRAASSAS